MFSACKAAGAEGFSRPEFGDVPAPDHGKYAGHGLLQRVSKRVSVVCQFRLAATSTQIYSMLYGKNITCRGECHDGSGKA